MADSYTVLWTKDHFKQIRRQRHEGETLKLLFGGPHLSEPRFSRFLVQPGDWIYLVHASGGVLLVLGRMKVERLMNYNAFLTENPNGLADWWDANRPEWSYLMPTCTDEVAIGAESSPLRLDISVPFDLLERWRFRSLKAERGLKSLENGRLKTGISFQGGIYRMTEATAQEVEALQANPKAISP